MNNKHTGQLQLPGITNVRYDNISPRTVLPGQKVVYVGRIDGGPGYGSVGNVIEIRSRKAVVEINHSWDMSRRDGIFHITY